MRTPSSQEDHVTLELLDRLSRDAEEALEDANLVREYAELLALLPCELEPVAPRAEVWRRIEDRIAEPAAGQPSSSKLVRFPRLSHAPEPSPAAPAPAPPPVAASQQVGWGNYAMAAALGLCLLGLGYLLAQTRYQHSTIQELNTSLSLVQAQSVQVNDRYSMVTRTARQYYPLRPVSLTPREEPVYGRVWVCGQHQQWLLNVEGLKPPPAGYEYHFWFETDSGQVDGGVVAVHAGKAQMTAPSMPLGTRGFSVTLEREGSRPPEPEGKVVLEAQEAQEMVLGIEDLVSDTQGLSM